MSYSHENSTYVSNTQAGSYTTLDTYSDQKVPRYSLLKLSVAPGSEKYFNTSRSFQARTSDISVNPSATPVSLNGGISTMAASRMMSTEKAMVNDADYQSLGGNAYKLSPQ